jgi:hypothetical protein
MLLVRSYRTFAPLPLIIQKSSFKAFFDFCTGAMLCAPTTFDLKKAVCFCGTILTLARTGRYPASLVFREAGLSSDLLDGQIRNCLAYSLIY